MRSLHHTDKSHPASDFLLTPSMHSPVSPIGIAAITENMLKRKWSANILRHVSNGLSTPDQILKREPLLTGKIAVERLRTMNRYALVIRRPYPSGQIEYFVTVRGKKILEILDLISATEKLLEQPETAAPANRGPYRTKSTFVSTSE